MQNTNEHKYNWLRSSLADLPSIQNHRVYARSTHNYNTNIAINIFYNPKLRCSSEKLNIAPFGLTSYSAGYHDSIILSL